MTQRHVSTNVRRTVCALGLAGLVTTSGWSGVARAIDQPVGVHAPAETGVPHRVRFAPGTDHASVHGAIGDGVSDRYVMRAGAGQQLTISGLGALHVSVTAPSGATLPGGPGDTLTFGLPATGDYVVEIMPGMGEQSAYDVTFTIPPAGFSTATTSRVRFPAGTFGTTVHHTVRGGRLDRYVLAAAAGRTMTVTITSARNNAEFSVLAPDGRVLAGEQVSASVPLPATGDYTVAVWSTRSNATYDLTFDIR